MDGLSAAGGVIAVGSLALQLVDTVKEVKHFLENVADAPKELQRLVDLLALLETILGTVVSILELEKSKEGTPFSQSIQAALLNCETKIKPLKKLIRNSNSVTNRKGKVSKIWGSLKLASKEEYIKDFECHLQHALTTLNVTLTANIRYEQSL
jgi:hypothetical protein